MMITMPCGIVFENENGISVLEMRNKHWTTCNFCKNAMDTKTVFSKTNGNSSQTSPKTSIQPKADPSPQTEKECSAQCLTGRPHVNEEKKGVLKKWLV